jgi:hypothetical protein
MSKNSLYPWLQMLEMDMLQRIKRLDNRIYELKKEDIGDPKLDNLKDHNAELYGSLNAIRLILSVLNRDESYIDLFPEVTKNFLEEKIILST